MAQQTARLRELKVNRPSQLIRSNSAGVSCRLMRETQFVEGDVEETGSVSKNAQFVSPRELPSSSRRALYGKNSQPVHWHI